MLICGLKNIYLLKHLHHKLVHCVFAAEHLNRFAVLVVVAAYEHRRTHSRCVSGIICVWLAADLRTTDTFSVIASKSAYITSGASNCLRRFSYFNIDPGSGILIACFPLIETHTSLWSARTLSELKHFRQCMQKCFLSLCCVWLYMKRLKSLIISTHSAASRPQLWVRGSARRRRRCHPSICILGKAAYPHSRTR